MSHFFEFLSPSNSRHLACGRRNKSETQKHSQRLSSKHWHHLWYVYWKLWACFYLCLSLCVDKSVSQPRASAGYLGVAPDGSVGRCVSAQAAPGFSGPSRARHCPTMDDMWSGRTRRRRSGVWDRSGRSLSDHWRSVVTQDPSPPATQQQSYHRGMVPPVHLTWSVEGIYIEHHSVKILHFTASPFEWTNLKNVSLVTWVPAWRVLTQQPQKMRPN